VNLTAPMPPNAILRFDSIQIIQSLPPGELQTGRTLFEEVEPIAINSRPSVTCRLNQVQTRTDLLQRLESIAADARTIPSAGVVGKAARLR
jgi:hypothetical protein